MSEPQQKNSAATRNIAWFLGVMLGVPILMGLLIWIGIKLIGLDWAWCYPHNPYAFTKQVKAIRPGMTEEELAGIVTIYSDVKRTPSKITYQLRPTRQPFTILALTLNIDVEISSVTKQVQRVTWRD